jgi:hypothetical protein
LGQGGRVVARTLRNSRIGVYECSISANGIVTKGRYIRGDYISVFNWDNFNEKILPDYLRNNRLRGATFPVLVASWQLEGTDPSKGVLGLSRKSLNLAPRKKRLGSEQWEAVIDSFGNSYMVKGKTAIEYKTYG